VKAKGKENCPRAWLNTTPRRRTGGVELSTHS